jgi:hypothetical protein
MTPWPTVHRVAQDLRRSLDPTPEDIANNVRPAPVLPALQDALQRAGETLGQAPPPGQEDAHRAVAALVEALSFGVEEIHRDLRGVHSGAAELGADLGQLLAP